MNRKSALVTAAVVFVAALVLTFTLVAQITPQQIQQRRRIAFSSGRADGDVTLEPYLMYPDGSGVTPIPYSGMPSIPRGVTVSPDNSKILFEAANDSNPTEVYTAALNGTAVTALTSSVSNRVPRWSPDGQRIVFMSNRDGLNGWLVYVMNADGSNQTRVSPLDDTLNDIYPSFSPDGNQIVFSCWDAPASAYAICTMNSDGSNRKSVLIPTGVITPAFSPDGRKILWVNNGEIASVNLDGSGQTTITHSGGMISELMSPPPAGARHLLKEVWFTTRQDGNLEVYKMHPTGLGQRNVTRNPHADALNLVVP